MLAIALKCMRDELGRNATWLLVRSVNLDNTARRSTTMTKARRLRRGPLVLPLFFSGRARGGATRLTYSEPSTPGIEPLPTVCPRFRPVAFDHQKLTLAV